jgi:hypothetical protein
MRLYLKLRKETYTSSSSRYVKKENIKEKAFIDVNIGLRKPFDASISASYAGPKLVLSTSGRGIAY